MNGKGSKSRKMFVSYQEFSNNWNSIFGKKPIKKAIVNGAVFYVCNRCNGDGEEPGSPIELENGIALCMDCAGSGYVTEAIFKENEENFKENQEETIQIIK